MNWYGMSLNKAMLIGNAGKDPEIRYIGSGPERMKVATFSIATTERYRDRTGAVREHTEWHNIVSWNSLADFVEKYVRKGALLYVEGHIRTRVWTGRSNEERTSVQIAAETVRILGRRQEPDEKARYGGDNPDRAAETGIAAEAISAARTVCTGPEEEDGLPF